MRAQERRISGQNGAGELHDYDSALYNDTSRKGDGAVEAGGTPMRYTRYRYKVFFLISADQCLSEDGQIGIDGQIFYVQNQREEHKHMREKVDLSEMVECHYKGAITYIPVQLFISMSMRVKFAGKKFIRYKDATQMYGMSLSTLKRFLQDTDVVYHPTDGVALINVEKMDALLEYYQGER